MGGLGSGRRRTLAGGRGQRVRGRPPDAAAASGCYGISQRHQDYTAIEHDTWRRLLERAEGLVERFGPRLHPAYVEGFRRLILPWNEIPRIEQLNTALEAFGWRTTCVDGYLPPEVYSGLLAEGVFPISRSIRPPQHLEFSPTPDLAHDLLGHIPMLISGAHCHFLRRISRATANTTPNARDRELYLSHRALGALRSSSNETAMHRDAVFASDPAAGSSSVRGELAAAEARVEAARAALAKAPSLLAQLDRLYLWTIEFGLMGTPDDFRIYGAGLLSSAAEVEALCHGNAPIVEVSTEVFGRDINFSDYQSMYFIARDHEQLHAVLTEVVGEGD